MRPATTPGAREAAPASSPRAPAAPPAPPPAPRGKVRALWRALAPGDDRPRHRRLVRLAGLAVIVAFALVAARRVDLAEVGRVLLSAHVGFVLLAMLANVASLAAHSSRWRVLVGASGKGGRVRFRDAFEAVTVGFAMGVVLPARAGDLVRAHVLGRRTGLATATTLAAAGLDYLVGAATLVPVLALLAVVTPLPAWASRALLAFSVIAAVGAVAALVLRPRRPGGHGLAARLQAGLAGAGNARAAAASAGYGLLGWAAEILIALAALAAVGLPATIAAAGLAVLATTAVNVVAVSPGNTGPFEAAVVATLAGLGADPATALAFALLYHLVHLVPVGLLGGWVLLREAARPAPEAGVAPTSAPERAARP